ncbi:hypothetical protein ACP70R_043165 [Stipagrostis hirtigluma subsp. patula]
MPLKLALIILPPLCVSCVVLYVAGVPWNLITRIAAVLVVFLVVIGLFDYLRRRATPAEQEQADDGSTSAPTREVALGLSAAAIAGLPAYKYKKEHGAGDECSVCLGEITPKEVVKQLPVCSHLFHDGCIDEWLRSHLTCPVCRTPVDAAAAPTPLELEVRAQAN